MNNQKKKYVVSCPDLDFVSACSPRSLAGALSIASEFLEHYGMRITITPYVDPPAEPADHSSE